jgi:ketosteroid isomerase-like protein
MTDFDNLIGRVQRSYEAAVFAKDVDALMRLYDPKVRVFDAWGAWLYKSADAWQIALEGWLGSLRDERVKVRFDDVQLISGQDATGVVLMSAIVTYSSVSSQGEPLRSMQNRLTWALRMAGHNLRIVHEHTSAPIGVEDMKAILQRDEPK